MSTPSDNEHERVALSVDGMSCGHCKATVEKALTGLAGVVDFEVDLQAGAARVGYRASELAPAAIAAALTRAGYPARVVGD